MPSSKVRGKLDECIIDTLAYERTNGKTLNDTHNGKKPKRNTRPLASASTWSGFVYWFMSLETAWALVWYPLLALIHVVVYFALVGFSRCKERRLGQGGCCCACLPSPVRERLMIGDDGPPYIKSSNIELTASPVQASP